MRAELPVMLAGGGGAIVNMASVLGTGGTVGSVAYVAAKHGVVGMTKTVALEYASGDPRQQCWTRIHRNPDVAPHQQEDLVLRGSAYSAGPQGHS